MSKRLLFFVVGSCLLPLLCSQAAMAQSSNCTISGTLTFSGATQVYDNRSNQCPVWQFSYYSSSFSSLTVQLEGAPDVSGTPGTFLIIPPLTGSNPSVAVGSAFFTVNQYYPWIRVNLLVAVGVGNFVFRAYGYLNTQSANLTVNPVVPATTDSVSFTAPGAGGLVSTVTAELAKVIRTSDYATLQNASDAAQNKRLLIDNTITVTANTTIPATVTTECAGLIKITTGFTVTIAGPLTVAGLRQCFSTQSTYPGFDGAVVFSGGVPIVYPQWFGGFTSGLQSAINAATGLELQFTGGTYTCSGITWGSSTLIQVVLKQGAIIAACTLPVADSTHWIRDERNGTLGLGGTSFGFGVTLPGPAPSGTIGANVFYSPNATINVRAYGAVGDGVTNDSTALLAAFAAACTVAGPPTGATKALYFPAGTYLTTPLTLCSYLTVKGDGSEVTKLKSFAGADVLVYTASAFLSRVTLEDFSIVGNGGAGHGININSPGGNANVAYLININRVNIYSAAGRCVYMPNSFNVHLSNMFIDNCGDNLIELNGGPGTFLEHIEGARVTAGKTFIRVYAGTPNITAVNGINGGGSWGVFGQSVADDGVLNFSFPTITGSNIESAVGIAVRFKTGSCGNFFGDSIESGPLAGAIVAVSFDGPSIHPCMLDGSTKMLLEGAGTWLNGWPIHVGGALTGHGPPFIMIGANTPTPQITASYWDDSLALLYPMAAIEAIANVEFQVNAVGAPRFAVANQGTGVTAGPSKFYIQASAAQSTTALMEVKNAAGNIFFTLDPASITKFFGDNTRTVSSVDNLGRLCINIATCLSDLHINHLQAGAVGPDIRLSNFAGSGTGDAGAIRYTQPGHEITQLKFASDGGGNGSFTFYGTGNGTDGTQLAQITSNVGLPTFLLQNASLITGITNETIKGGVAQGSAKLLDVQSNGGASIFSVTPTGPTVTVGNGAANQVVCWKTSGFIGWCSTVVSAGGACTCN